MATQIQVRRDTAANWTSSNPILAQGEQGLEIDTGKVKFGNGVDVWTSRPYSGSGEVQLQDLQDVNVPSPTSGDFLKYDGTDWIPTQTTSTANLDDVTTLGNTTTNDITVGQVNCTDIDIDSGNVQWSPSDGLLLTAQNFGQTLRLSSAEALGDTSLRLSDLVVYYNVELKNSSFRIVNASGPLLSATSHTSVRWGSFSAISGCNHSFVGLTVGMANLKLTDLVDAADDTAAAAAGVEVDEVYHNNGVLRIRLT